MHAIAITRPYSVIGASEREAEQIDEAINVLAETVHGRDVAAHLLDGNVTFQVLDDAAYDRSHPGSGAVYVQRADTIVMPRSLLWQQNLVTTVAHEGQHALDKARAGGAVVSSIRTVAGGFTDGLSGMLQLRNPVSAFVDGLERRDQEHEVQAYAVQARVAQELGYDESAWSLGQAPGGAPLTVEEIRQRVSSTPLYDMPEHHRTIQAAAFGALLVSAGSQASLRMTELLSPNSYLAARTWPHLVTVGVIAGALVAEDQLRHARLTAARQSDTTVS